MDGDLWDEYWNARDAQVLSMHVAGDGPARKVAVVCF